MKFFGTRSRKRFHFVLLLHLPRYKMAGNTNSSPNSKQTKIFAQIFEKTLSYHLNHTVYRNCQSNQSRKSLINRHSINHKGKTNMAVKCENITKRLTKARFALVTNFRRTLLSKTRSSRNRPGFINRFWKRRTSFTRCRALIKTVDF